MNSTRHYSIFDKLIMESDRVLRTLNNNARQFDHHNSPAQPVEDVELSDAERKHSAGLMRVNHTGEVCAQALYQGQALTAKLPHVREEMEQAAAEEVDHLNWCSERLQQLNDRPSLLNPIFYGLSFSMGAFTGAISDQISLGFVAATEELVCQHLQEHLQTLPETDLKSCSIVSQMLKDEARHQQSALDAGGRNFPPPAKFAMKLMSKVMTKTTYSI
jgi:ubiquinone biosynthesis monooxygenase Coq7